MKNCIRCICFVLIFCLGCTQPQDKAGGEYGELKHFPLDSMEGVIARSGVAMDRGISSDGNGSLKITTSEDAVIKLFQVSDIDVENARLLYQAKVRTDAVQGDVYLEMWVHVAGKGEFFTRNIHTPLSGSTDWTTMEALFFLEKGQNPDYVKLNLVMTGPGTVWIDDISLVKGPLH